MRPHQRLRCLCLPLWLTAVVRAGFARAPSCAQLRSRCIHLSAADGVPPRDGSPEILPAETAEYLSRHPELAATLQFAIEQVVISNDPDPQSTIAAALAQGAAGGAVLPPPSECPPEGVQFKNRLPAEGEKASVWIFHWNHFVNLDFFNKQMLDGLPVWELPQNAYPARMRASAGYRREWSIRGGVGR